MLQQQKKSHIIHNIKKIRKNVNRRLNKSEMNLSNFSKSKATDILPSDEKQQTKQFDINNIYKILETNNQSSIVEPSVFLTKKKGLSQSIKIRKDDNSKEDNDIVSVIGKVKSIKENAYSNVDATLSNVHRMRESQIRSQMHHTRRISDSAYGDKLTQQNLKSFSKYN